MGKIHGAAGGGESVAELVAAILAMPRQDALSFRRAAYASALMAAAKAPQGALRVRFRGCEGDWGFGLLRSDGLGVALELEYPFEDASKHNWVSRLGFGPPTSPDRDGLFDAGSLVCALAPHREPGEADAQGRGPWGIAAGILARKPRASVVALREWDLGASVAERRLAEALAGVGPGEAVQALIKAGQARAMEAESGVCRVEHRSRMEHDVVYATAVGCDGRLALLCNATPLQWIAPEEADVDALVGVALGFEEWESLGKDCEGAEDFLAANRAHKERVELAKTSGEAIEAARGSRERIDALAAAILALPPRDADAIHSGAYGAALRAAQRRPGGGLSVMDWLAEGGWRWRGSGDKEVPREVAYEFSMVAGAMFEAGALLDAVAGRMAGPGKEAGPQVPWHAGASALAKAPRREDCALARWEREASEQERALADALEGLEPGEMARGWALAAQRRAIDSESGVCRVSRQSSIDADVFYATAMGSDGRLARFCNWGEMEIVDIEKADMQSLAEVALGYEDWASVDTECEGGVEFFEASRAYRERLALAAVSSPAGKGNRRPRL